MRRRARPLRPDRVRRLEKPFGWMPFRLMTSGLLAELNVEAKLLNFFLCLVADREGLSFYGDERLQQVLGLSAGELARARAELCDRDLLAYDGWLYQVLSLPEQATEAPQPPRRSRPSPERQRPRRRGSGAPERVGEILRRLAQSGDDGEPSRPGE